jgi:hypothetical protein
MPHVGHDEVSAGDRASEMPSCCAKWCGRWDVVVPCYMVWPREAAEQVCRVIQQVTMHVLVVLAEWFGDYLAS